METALRHILQKSVESYSITYNNGFMYGGVRLENIVEDPPLGIFDVLSYLSDNACKRPLSICRKSRALCSVSRLLSVPI